MSVDWQNRSLAEHGYVSEGRATFMGLWKDPMYYPWDPHMNTDTDYANWDNEAAKVRRRTPARLCGWGHGEDRAERACMPDSRAWTHARICGECEG